MEDRVPDLHRLKPGMDLSGKVFKQDGWELAFGISPCTSQHREIAGQAGCSRQVLCWRLRCSPWTVLPCSSLWSWAEFCSRGVHSKKAGLLLPYPRTSEMPLTKSYTSLISW